MAGKSKLIEDALAAAARATGIIPGTFPGKKLPSVDALANTADKFVYHSGLAEDVPSMKYGVDPQIGPWVKEVLNSSTDEDDLLREIEENAVPVSWWSKEPSWAAVKVARKLDKPVSEVTPEELAQYGHVALIPKKDPEAEHMFWVGEEGLSMGPYSEIEDITGKKVKAYNTDLFSGNYGPEGVETNEYITPRSVEPYLHLTGSDLVEFLRKTGNYNKSEGGSVREGYQTKGRVVGDVVEQALKLLPGSEDAAEAAIRAYHGSPHEFGEFKFTPREIGSGEGAQAYGYGGYFAESEPLAESYTQARDWSYKGKSAQDIYDDLYKVSRERGLDNEGWSKLNAQRGFWERVLTGRSPRSLIMEGKINPDDYSASDLVYHKTLDPEKFVRNEGHMYEVGISSDPNNFVDWDEVISEQPEAFKEYMRDHLKKQGYLRSKDNGPRQLSSALKSWNMEKGSVGETPIQSIIMGRGNIGGGTPVGVSKDLQSLGVPGVKFLDSQSRGLGTGTRNYVIFPGNEDLVKIIRSYADGGEVYEDDDIDDALRIAKDVGGSTSAVMMEDAKGNKYDAQGNIIPQTSTGDNPARSDAAPQQNAMFNAAPQNYSQDVQPFIDYAVTPIDRPGMPSEPDLVDVMRVATQVAAEGQPKDERGQQNWGRARTEAVRNLMGAPVEGYSSPQTGPFTYNPSDMANFVNTLMDFSPTALAEVAHDIPYEAGRTGDYKTAAIEGGINAALTAPVLGLAGRGIKKGYDLAKQFPKTLAGAAGVTAATSDPSQAEAGPARWFSKALEVAREIPMQKMTGEQALAMLRKGTSPEELRWMGAEDFLSGQKSVSKDDLVAFLEKNRVQLNEINLGGSNKPTKLEDIDIINVPAEIRDRHLDVYSLSNKVEELRDELKKLRSMPDQSGLDYYDNFRAVSKEFSDAQAKLMRVKEAIRKEYAESIGGLGRPSKYGPDSGYGETLTTPGGGNYRENLFAIPQRDIYTPFVDQMRRDVWNANYKEAIQNGFAEDRARAFADKFNNLQPHQLAKFLGKEDELQSVYEAQKSYQPQYIGGHWREYPDVLFHTRTNELTYEPPGANRPFRVHNVEETQSDPGQAGRKSGFKDQKAMAAVARLSMETKELQANANEAVKSIRAKHSENIRPIREAQNKYDDDLRDQYRSGKISIGEMNRLSDEYENIVSEQMAPYLEQYRAEMESIVGPIKKKILANEVEMERLGSNIGDIPVMPYVTSTDAWTDRAIKQELDRAFDAGSDYFSWTPGEVQADRYGLEKHLSKIQYNPDDGSLMAYDPNGKMVVNESVSDPDDLDEYIGKELADKMRLEAESRRSVIDEYEIAKDEETGEWGVYLYGEPTSETFPSKGHARDYLNEIVANELAQSPAELSGLDLKVGGEGMRGYYDKVYLKRVQEVIRKATGEKPVIETIEVQTADGPRKQLGIRLTDEMREKARFSDFKKGGRVTGENTYDNDPSVANALALTREY